MTLLLGAMEGEVAGIVGRMAGVAEASYGLVRVRTGTLKGCNVAVARTGVGKAMAAAVTARLIERIEPESIVYVGVAGALSADLDIGDVVVATESLQHDLDATIFGFARGEIPYDGIRLLLGDPVLAEIAVRYRPSSGKLVAGRILTGDQFCSASLRSERPWLAGELEGIAVEMEGTAAAIAAHLAGVPFLHARVISDRADGSASVDFGRFLPLAADRIADFVEYLVKCSGNCG
jgi:adenosylhomocysteine nucleosidase